MSDQTRREIDAILHRIYDRISDLETRLHTIEASVDAEISRAFASSLPENPKPI